MNLKKFLKDQITEADGQSYCPFRVAACSLTAGGIPTFLGLAVWNVVIKDHSFSMSDFGIAFSAMLTGVGVLAGAVGAKARFTERGPDGK